MSLWDYVFLVFIALLAGMVDAVSGGGGILTIPALLTVGVSPQFALGTNKLQASFGSFTSAMNYMRSGLIVYKKIGVGILFTAIGALGGTKSIQFIPREMLTYIIIILLSIVFIYFLLFSQHAENRAQKYIPISIFYIIFGLLVGFYDGFFGPGTGSLWAFFFITMAGYNLKKATANTKVMNFTSNIVALMTFLSMKMVIFKIGFLMGIFQTLGSVFGSQFVIKKNLIYIKMVYLLVVLGTLTKLVVQIW